MSFKLVNFFTFIDFDGRPYNSLTLPCERVMWCRDGEYWIGLQKNEYTEWLDANPSSYRRWASGEPNSNDQCVRYTSNRFKDTGCDDDQYFLCKRGAGNLFSLTSLSKARAFY